MIKRQKDELLILRISKSLIASKIKVLLYKEYAKTIPYSLSFHSFNIYIPKIINIKKMKKIFIKLVLLKRLFKVLVK